MTFFSRKNLKFFSIVIALSLVIIISLRGADNPVKGLVLRISSPFLKTFRIFSSGTAGFIDFLGSIGDLKKENENLLKKNQELLAENTRLSDMEHENQVLREELNLAPRKEFDLEAAFVIAQDPQGLGNFVLIDKGADKGIKIGMPAIVSNGILVGRVSEVYPNTTKVTLIADPASAINAEVQDSGAKGIVNGEFGLGLKMNMISQTEEIKEGDTVISSGLGGEMPRGLTIGRIDNVGQSEDKLFQEASVLPAVNYGDLRVVFIVKKF